MNVEQPDLLTVGLCAKRPSSQLVRSEPTSEVAWAAGLFEGEGCIWRSKPGAKQTGRALVLNSTDEDVVERFCAAVGVGKVRQRARTPAWQPHWKDQWEWRVTGWANLVTVLNLFQPYLGTRRLAAATAMLADPPWRPGEPRKEWCVRGHPLAGAGSDVQLAPRGDRVVRVCRHCNRDRRRGR